MNKSSFTVVLLSAVLAACSTTRAPAPVHDRADRSGVVRPSVAQPIVPRASDPRGFYTVQRGDTLIQIALEFGQNYRDIVAWNDLANPNDIKINQLLRVLPPEGAPEAASVATSSGVETRPLPSQPSQTAASAPNKTGPIGDKRPYSETALDELKRPAKSLPAPPVAVAPAPRPETRPVPPPAALPGGDTISWIWPTAGKVSAPFGEGRRGVVISGNLGQPVVAAGAGKVIYAGNSIRGYGNLIIVKHTNNLLSAYAHNASIFVKEEQTVTQGQKIAEMGNSDADEVKLHFEIRHQGKPVDPLKYLPSR